MLSSQKDTNKILVFKTKINLTAWKMGRKQKNKSTTEPITKTKRAKSGILLLVFVDETEFHHIFALK